MSIINEIFGSEKTHSVGVGIHRCRECNNVLIGKQKAQCKKCKAPICMKNRECHNKHVLRHQKQEKAQGAVNQFVAGASKEALADLTLRDFLPSAPALGLTSAQTSTAEPSRQVKRRRLRDAAKGRGWRVPLDQNSAEIPSELLSPERE